MNWAKFGKKPSLELIKIVEMWGISRATQSRGGLGLNPAILFLACIPLGVAAAAAAAGTCVYTDHIRPPVRPTDPLSRRTDGRSCSMLLLAVRLLKERGRQGEGEGKTDYGLRGGVPRW